MLDPKPIKQIDLMAVYTAHKLLLRRGRDAFYVLGIYTLALAHKLSNLGPQWERC